MAAPRSICAGHEGGDILGNVLLPAQHGQPPIWYSGQAPADPGQTARHTSCRVRIVAECDGGLHRGFIAVLLQRDSRAMQEIDTVTATATARRSEERRVGKVWVSTCRSRW